MTAEPVPLKTLGQILYEAGNLHHFGEHGDYLDEHEHARASHELAAQAVVAENERRAWRPIGEATEQDKDGQELLGINDEGIRQVIRWSKHNHVPIWGWVRQIELYGEEVDSFEPTHFRALPAPPEVQG